MQIRSLSTLIGVLALAVVAIACAPLVGGWSTTSLQAAAPALVAHEGHRLGDTPPYFLPHENEATLFLCRFDTNEPITVSLPVVATPEQSAAIRLALEGWTNAGLGVAFVEAPPTQARIEIRFVKSGWEGAPGAPRARNSGYTVSECQVGPEWRSADDAGGPIPASIRRASVALRKSNTNMIGREIPLSEDELVGVALHELGHALGFPGHLATESGVMSKSTDTVRRFGRILRSEGSFASPTLAALYALPSGTIVGRSAFVRGEAGLFDRASELAANGDWQGPFIRVGEEHASIHWRDHNGRPRALRIPGYRAKLLEGRPLHFSSGHFETVLRGRTRALPVLPR